MEEMNKIRDQHMHSNFSFDSKEEIERYIEVACGNKIVTTEHLEFGNPVVEYSDNIPEDTAYRNEINRLNQKYGQCVLSGIEIGYVDRYEEKIQDFLKNKTYDLKLLSIHHDGEHDFIQEWAHKQPVEWLIPHYYQKMIQALESDVSANVLAHFEYGVRYISITTEQFIEGARNFVDKVIDLVIQKEMALEINTRSMYQYRKIDLYDYVTDCYIKKGGRLFSIGSDAHQVGVYQYHFDDAVHFLKQKNVKEIALFEKGELSLQELE